MISRTRPPLCAERLSITTTCPGESVGASTASRYVSNTSRVVGPSTASDGPIPQRLILESSVTFFPSCVAPSQVPAPLVLTKRRAAPERCLPHTRPQTRGVSLRCRLRQRPSPSRRLSRTRRAAPLPAIFFSAEAHVPQRSRDSGVAHLNPSHTRQQFTSLRESGRRAFVQVALEEPLRYPIHLTPLAGRLARGQLFAAFGPASVAFDRREADTEGASDSCLGRAGLNSLDDLTSEIH